MKGIRGSTPRPRCPPAALSTCSSPSAPTPPHRATPDAQQDALIIESWYPGTQTLTFQVTTPRGYTSNTIGLDQEATKQTNDGTIYVGVVRAVQNNDNTCEIDLWDGSATSLRTRERGRCG